MKFPVVVELLELEPEVELELELQLLDCQRCCSGTLVKCPAVVLTPGELLTRQWDCNARLPI